MNRPSLTAARLARSLPPGVPHSFLPRHGRPPGWLIRELVWGCWVAVADELLGGSPPPGELVVGREHVALAVPPQAWADFRDELGLTPPAAEWAGRVLRAEFGAEPPLPPADASPSDPLVGLVALTCRLCQLARGHRPDDYRFDEEVLAATAARHPTPAFGHLSAGAACRAVFAFADLSGDLRPLVAQVYRPLRHRLDRRIAAATPPAVPAERPTATAPQTAELLAAVMEAWLSAARLPPADAEPDRGLLRAMGLNVTQLLRRGDVTFFGEPDEVVGLQLPFPGWQLDDRYPPVQQPDRICRYRVRRRGLLLNGRVAVPALVVPDEEFS